MYVILGATGNTGKLIAEELLQAGKAVRVVGRDAAKLQSFVDKGAEAVTGSVEDAVFLATAFSGAQAVYSIIPPNFATEDYIAYQNRVSVAMTDALKNAGVRYVVNLSSRGADRPDGTGPIKGLYAHEQRLNALEGVNVLHLRPTYFMENFFFSIDLIKHQGINGSPIAPDLQMPVIATKDIGAAAAQRLLALDFSGASVWDLLGASDHSMNEMTAIIGKAIGKDNLPYVQFPYEDAEKAMIDAGITPDFAALYTEMYHAINDHTMDSGADRNPQSTTPTTFEEFAGVFASVYAG